MQADPEAYLLPGTGLRLVRCLAARPDLALALPVSNESESEEGRTAPPFAYLTPTLLSEAAAFIEASSGLLRPATAPASPVFAVRRSILATFPGELPLRNGRTLA